MARKWKCKKSEIILDAKYMKVRKDTVELPNKEIKEWVYWDSRDSVMILGMTRSKKLIMIRQYRYLVGKEVIEFPAGGVDRGESVLAAARREFQEETTYQCHRLIKFGVFYESYGQVSRKIHLFFTPDVQKVKKKVEQGPRWYEEIKVKLVSLEEAVGLARKNVILETGQALSVLLLKDSIDRKEIRI